MAATGSRPGNLALASLATSSRLFELDSTAWSNNTACVLVRNVSSTAIDLAAATLSAQVTNASTITRGTDRGDLCLKGHVV
jgi:hypothetical protein